MLSLRVLFSLILLFSLIIGKLGGVFSCAKGRARAKEVNVLSWCRRYEITRFARFYTGIKTEADMA